MTIITLIIYFLLPIVGGLFPLISYFLINKKNSFLNSLLIGLTLGIIAYYFIPPQNYDLYRHHLIVYKFVGKDWAYLQTASKIMDVELLPLIISYIVSLTKNIDLLQFVITTVGYTIILYIMHDYRKDNNIHLLIFIIIVLFTFFGFNALNFISGLWNYIAIIIFALAMYFDYIKQKNKILCYILYFSTIFFHSSMVFPLVILIIYKYFNNKLNIKNIIIAISICVFPAIVLEFINSIVNIEILKTVEQLYNSYFENEYMYNFYGGTVFLIEISKLIIILTTILFQKQKNKITNINGYIILLSICMLLTLPQSIVMIRFVMLIQFIGIIPLIDNFKKFTRNKVILLTLMMFLSIFYISYFCALFRNQNFGMLFDTGILKNIITIFRK